VGSKRKYTAVFRTELLILNNFEAKSSKMLTRLTMYTTLEKTSNLGNKINFEQKRDVPSGLQSVVGSVFGYSTYHTCANIFL